MSQPPSTIPKLPAGKKWGVFTAVLVLVLAIAAVLAYAMRGRDHTSRSATNEASSPSQVAQPDGPNGCVGGSDPSTAISSAFNEPMTQRGAIQFTATTLRWLYDTDVEPSQLQSVGPRVADKGYLDALKDNTTDVPQGAHAGISTKNSYAWVKDFDAAKGNADLVFSTKYVASVPGTDTLSKDMVFAVKLTKKDDHWYLNSTDSNKTYGAGDAGFQRMTQDAITRGTPLAGGCGE